MLSTGFMEQLMQKWFPKLPKSPNETWLPLSTKILTMVFVALFSSFGVSLVILAFEKVHKKIKNAKKMDKIVVKIAK